MNPKKRYFRHSEKLENNIYHRNYSKERSKTKEKDTNSEREKYKKRAIAGNKETSAASTVLGNSDEFIKHGGNSGEFKSARSRNNEFAFPIDNIRATDCGLKESKNKDASNKFYRGRERTDICPATCSGQIYTATTTKSKFCGGHGDCNKGHAAISDDTRRSGSESEHFRGKRNVRKHDTHSHVLSRGRHTGLPTGRGMVTYNQLPHNTSKANGPTESEAFRKSTSTFLQSEDSGISRKSTFSRKYRSRQFRLSRRTRVFRRFMDSRTSRSSRSNTSRTPSSFRSYDFRRPSNFRRSSNSRRSSDSRRSSNSRRPSNSRNSNNYSISGSSRTSRESRGRIQTRRPIGHVGPILSHEFIKTEKLVESLRLALRKVGKHSSMSGSVERNDNSRILPITVQRKGECYESSKRYTHSSSDTKNVTEPREMICEPIKKDAAFDNSTSISKVSRKYNSAEKTNKKQKRETSSMKEDYTKNEEREEDRISKKTRKHFSMSEMKKQENRNLKSENKTERPFNRKTKTSWGCKEEGEKKKEGVGDDEEEKRVTEVPSLHFSNVTNTMEDVEEEQKERHKKEEDGHKDEEKVDEDKKKEVEEKKVEEKEEENGKYSGTENGDNDDRDNDDGDNDDGDNDDGDNDDGDNDEDDDDGEDDDEINEYRNESDSSEDETIQLECIRNGCRSVKNYKKLNKISSGTYGTVYRAINRTTHKIVALKQLKNFSNMQKQGFAVTSLREIHFLLQLKHKNILSVKEVVVGNHLNDIYLVMTYVEHELKLLLDNKVPNFTVAELKCLLKQLLSGLNYLHTNWVMHRDLKTTNLLYNNKGILKICDFGMSRKFSIPPNNNLTRNVVTLWYRAPELLLDEKIYTNKIDIWSVGCIFAEMFLKRPLFTGENEIKQIMSILDVLGLPDPKTYPKFYEYTFIQKNKQFFQKHEEKYKTNKIRNLFPNVANQFAGSGVYLSENGFDLLQKMLHWNPEERISATEALNHPYFQEIPKPTEISDMPKIPDTNKMVRSKKMEQRIRILNSRNIRFHF